MIDMIFMFESIVVDSFILLTVSAIIILEYINVNSIDISIFIKNINMSFFGVYDGIDIEILRKNHFD